MKKIKTSPVRVLTPVSGKELREKQAQKEREERNAGREKG